MQCDYECLDQIADAVNPTLALLAIGMGLFSRAVGRCGRMRWFAMLTTLVACVYALQWLDLTLSLWKRWGGDYSTHTAFALAVCVPLSLLSIRWRAFAGLVFVGYVLLMLYQGYHSVADMASTTAAMASLTLLDLWIVSRVVVSPSHHGVSKDRTTGQGNVEG